MTNQAQASASVRSRTGPEGGRLVIAAGDLYRRGWMDGTAGNISERIEEDPELAIITATGRRKDGLTPEDFTVVSVATAERVSPLEPRPSAETSIHAALYRIDPGCQAVVHAHPPWCTAAASLAAGPQLDFTSFEIIKGLGVSDPSAVSVPVFANWSDVPRIAADIEDRLKGEIDRVPPVLLIAHHGATAWGPSLDVARNRLESLEALCQVWLLTKGYEAR
jgi:methylthioribulose-1-phosphate dehydratase